MCVYISLCLLNVFVHANCRHKKGKKEYAVHYVKEGPKVDIISTEPQYDTVAEPQYAAGVGTHSIMHGHTVCVCMPNLQSLLFILIFSDQ